MSDATASGGRLGRYHLVEPIGGGANGEVFRAKVYGVAGFERQFAVKKFFPHVALNSRYAQALSAAARAYGSLEHPRIARLAEFGVSGGHTFTATELVPGLDAARLLAETLGSGGTIPAGSALALVSQAARAVGYAHGRGISHLGVAPTNLIISAEGEVRVTDIGVCGACLPDRPAHDGRFVTRIHYLAPEQLTGEPCSAATDVFSLGLVAYELITGERAFIGLTPEDVAQAILTGQPREPQLPRPIMRVLQRCLARSPFERFPDARALADALDAALRVSPVPGTRGEIAELAKIALGRIAALHEQQLSGALQLNLPSAGGFARPDTVADRGPPPIDPPTAPFNRESADTTMPELATGPATTMQGMAPPPIPVPQGINAPPRGAAAFPGPAPTLQGVPPVRIPSIRPQTGGIPPPIPPGSPGSAAVRAPSQGIPQIPVRAPSQAIPRPVTARSDVTDATPPPAIPSSPPPPPPPPGPPIAGPGSSGRLPPLPDRFATSDPTTDASRRMQTEPPPAPAFDRRATTGEPVPPPTTPPFAAPSPAMFDRRATTGEPVPPPPPPSSGRFPRSDSTGEPVLPPPPPEPIPSLLDGASSMRSGPPPAYDTFAGLRAPGGPPAAHTESVHTHRGSRRGLTIALVAIAVAAAGGGGYFAYTYYTSESEPAPTKPVAGSGGHDAATVAVGRPDAATVATTPADAAGPAGDAATIAALIDAGTVAADVDAVAVAVADIDAAGTANPDPVDAAVVIAPAADGKLTIDSKPSGARVFLDGADQGATPVSLPGSADRHSVALVLPDHAPYIAEIDGKGQFTIPLEDVTPSAGPAGIKIKCKAKDRYVVFLDGKPTGQLCPTERLEVEMGEHLVEIYDLVTETRRQFPCNVQETRLSFRIKVDY